MLEHKETCLYLIIILFFSQEYTAPVSPIWLQYYYNITGYYLNI